MSLSLQLGLVYLISEVLLTRRYIFPAVLFFKFGGLSTFLRQAYSESVRERGGGQAQKRICE